MRHTARLRSLVQTIFLFTVTLQIVHVEKVQSYYNNFADYNNRIHYPTTVRGLQMLLFTRISFDLALIEG